MSEIIFNNGRTYDIFYRSKQLHDCYDSPESNYFIRKRKSNIEIITHIEMKYEVKYIQSKYLQCSNLQTDLKLQDMTSMYIMFINVHFKLLSPLEFLTTFTAFNRWRCGRAIHATRRYSKIRIASRMGSNPVSSKPLFP